MERWCGVFIENLQHCQEAGTFRSFEERSGSDAFILYLPLIQECLNFVCLTISFEFCVSEFSLFEFGVPEGWAGGTTQWRFRLYYITCTEDSCHMFHQVPGKLKLFICVCNNANILAVHYFLWVVLLQASGEGGSFLFGLDGLFGCVQGCQGCLRAVVPLRKAMHRKIITKHPNRFEVVLECLHVTKLFILGGQLKHLLRLASTLNLCQFLLRASLPATNHG